MADQSKQGLVDLDPFDAVENKEPKRPLRLMDQNSIFAGVCAGIAYALGIPTWIVRLVAVCLALSGTGILVYIIMWIILPDWEPDPPDFDAVTGD